MIIEAKDNNITFMNYDEKKSYNVKDIIISIPKEPSVSNPSVLIGSEQFDLDFKQLEGDNNLYSIKLMKEVLAAVRNR